MMISKWMRSALFWVLCAGVLTFILMEVLALYPAVTEKFYTQGLYPPVSLFLSRISTNLPFSMDDVFYLVLAIGLLVLIILLIMGKITWKKVVSRFLMTMTGVYICFNWFWGFNYYRSDLSSRFGYTEARADADELLRVFGWLVDEVNQNYMPVDTMEWDPLVELLCEEYEKQSSSLQIDSRLCKVRPKYISLSRFFAAGSIGGYYGPFFSEVHVNRYLMPLELPVVMAHEMAHRLGVAYEAEANFYAWYVCSHSGDQRLRYSGNLYLMRYFAYEVYRLPGYEEVIKRLRPQVKEDIRTIRSHWQALMNKNVDQLTTTVNDAYLKSNKVKDGVDNYDGVVKCVMDYLNSHERPTGVEVP